MVREPHAAIHPDFGVFDGPRSTKRLTPAELGVLTLVALGLTSREIAERLWVSRQAVTYHIGNLFMKLRADSRAGLVARAYAIGILVPGTWPPAVDPHHVVIATLAPRSARRREGTQPAGRSGMAAPIDAQTPRLSRAG